MAVTTCVSVQCLHRNHALLKVTDMCQKCGVMWQGSCSECNTEVPCSPRRGTLMERCPMCGALTQRGVSETKVEPCLSDVCMGDGGYFRYDEKHNRFMRCKDCGAAYPVKSCVNPECCANEPYKEMGTYCVGRAAS